MITTFAPTRVLIERLLALGGLAIVLLEIFAFGFSVIHVLVLALGTLMIYVGSWRLTGGFMRDRSNVVLRSEIERFLILVRQLYSSRTRADSAAIHETKAKVRESAELIISAAGTLKDEI
jgi:hypothetical protein